MTELLELISDPPPEMSLKGMLEMKKEEPKRAFFKYNLTVTDEQGEVVREMELLRAKETVVVERVEAVKVLLEFADKVKREPEPAPGPFVSTELPNRTNIRYASSAVGVFNDF